MVNDLIGTITRKHEQSDAAVEDECRRSLDAMVSHVELHPPQASGFEPLKRKRQHYDNKKEIIDLIDADTAKGASTADAVKRLRTVQGYEYVTAGMISGWRKSGPVRKRGRKPQSDFETAVVSELMFLRLETVDNEGKQEQGCCIGPP